MVFYHVKWHTIEEGKVKEKKKKNEGEKNLGSLNMNLFYFVPVAWRSSLKKLFLQNLKVESFVRKDLQPAILLKKKLLHRCFPVNNWKFLRALIL